MTLQTNTFSGLKRNLIVAYSFLMMGTGRVTGPEEQHKAASGAGWVLGEGSSLRDWSGTRTGSLKKQSQF